MLKNTKNSLNVTNEKSSMPFAHFLLSSIFPSPISFILPSSLFQRKAWMFFTWQNFTRKKFWFSIYHSNNARNFIQRYIKAQKRLGKLAYTGETRAPIPKIQLLLCRDLLALDARANALASVFIIIHCLSARRWCCRAFFARFGAKRVSLSTNASLNFSATDNSVGLKREAALGFGVNPHIAHVFGSISLTTE